MDFQPMPKEIASSIMLVMRAVGRLVKDSKNNHGGYSYASTDTFYEAINPACAEAGLIIKPRLVSSQFLTVETTKDGKTTPKRMVECLYKFMLIHESGATWCDPEDTQRIVVDHTGPQAFGAAQSYAHKTFMRSLFIVATGDKDADSEEQFSAELIRQTVKAVKAKRETGGSQIMIDFGNGLENIAATDVTSRVLQHMTSLGDANECVGWWNAQKHGREQFHNEFPKLALDLKKKVEGFVASIATHEAA